jgi:hypothetical protein
MKPYSRIPHRPIESLSLKNKKPLIYLALIGVTVILPICALVSMYLPPDFLHFLQPLYPKVDLLGWKLLMGLVASPSLLAPLLLIVLFQRKRFQWRFTTKSLIYGWLVGIGFAALVAEPQGGCIVDISWYAPQITAFFVMTIIPVYMHRQRETSSLT